MKIYTKLVLDINDNVIEENYFDYKGPVSNCGIHYDFKSLRGVKAMEKQAKREKKLAMRRAKKLAKQGDKKSSEDKIIPIDQVITLDHLTNPDKK